MNRCRSGPAAVHRRGVGAERKNITVKIIIIYYCCYVILLLTIWRHENRQRARRPADGRLRRVVHVRRGRVLFSDRLVVLVPGAGRTVRRRPGLQVSAVRHEFRERPLRGRRPVRVRIRVPLDSRCRGARRRRVRLLRHQVAAVPGRPAPRRTPARTTTVARPTARGQVYPRT